MKKPMMKERVGLFCERGGAYIHQRARLTDARRPSALRAVEKVLQAAWDAELNAENWRMPEWVLKSGIGMIAQIVNGKVTCNWRIET